MNIAADRQEALIRAFAGRLQITEAAATSDGLHGNGNFDGRSVNVAWLAAVARPDWPRAAERRRYAPTPPCPRLLGAIVDASGMAIVSAQPVGEPFNALAPPAARDEAFARLDAIANAIDQLHRYRLAHGQLNDHCIVFDGSTVWLRDVGIAWGDLGSTEGKSPQERDLAYLDDLARRLLRTLQPTYSADFVTAPPTSSPAQRLTARSLIARLQAAVPVREPAAPVPSESPATTEEPTPVPEATAAPTAWRRLRWLAPAIVGTCITAVIGGGLAFQYGWMQSSLTPEPPRPLVPQRVTRRHLCEEMVRQVRNQNSIAALETLLATDGPEQIEYLLALVNDREETLQRFLIDAATKITWTPEKRGKLGTLQERAGGLGSQALAHWFLAGCGAEGYETVVRLRRFPGAPLRVAALAALARIGQPVPVAEIIAEYHRVADAPSRRKLLLLALVYPQSAELTAFLEAQLFDGTGRPRHLLFELAFERPTASAARLTCRALSKIFANDSELSVADALPAWVAATRLSRQTPEVRPSHPALPMKQPAFLREAAALVLSETGIRMRLGDELLPDTWHARALSWPDAKPLDFLDSIYLSADSRVEPLGELRLQSMLLTLANVEDTATEKALVDKLIARTPWERWETERPVSVAAVVTVLAASGTDRGTAFVEKYLGDDHLHRSPLFWDAAVAGAALAPAATNALLHRAADHPLPAISLRARRILALGADSPENIHSVRPAALPEQGSLIRLVDKLRLGDPDDHSFLRQTERDHSQLLGLALVLCDTPRGAAGLYTRWVNGGAALTDTYLLANLEETNVVGLWEGFLPHSQWPSLMQQPMLSTAGMLRDETWVPLVRRVAIGETPQPPLWHRYLAVRALGEFHQDPTSTYLEILAHEQSTLVQHAAAMSYLLTGLDPGSARSHLVSLTQMRPKVRAALVHGRSAQRRRTDATVP